MTKHPTPHAFFVSALWVVATVACSDSAGVLPDGQSSLDSSIDSASTTDAQQCNRMPAAADRARKVVVSHPFDMNAGQANEYEVFDLATNGTLSRPGTTFSMGRVSLGEIVFTPDGEVGIVAQQDGTLGVFRFDTGGNPVVVHSNFAGAYSAARVVMGPAGQIAYVIDMQTRNNGGGIYRVRIGCDGSLTNEGLIAAARSPGDIVVLANGDALVGSKDILNSATTDVHLLSWPSNPMVLSGTTPFSDTDAFVSDIGMIADGRHALIADNSPFIFGRLGVVEITGTTLTARQEITPVEDPVSVVISPWDNAAIAVSGFGDAIFSLSYDANTPSAPFTLDGELSYSGVRPQLPSIAVLINRGGLLGLVLVAENLGIRQAEFAANGAVTDLGLGWTSTGTENIVGAIGVQP